VRSSWGHFFSVQDVDDAETEYELSTAQEKGEKNILYQIMFRAKFFAGLRISCVYNSQMKKISQEERTFCGISLDS
jgi:hypothetical protein